MSLNPEAIWVFLYNARPTSVQVDVCHFFLLLCLYEFTFLSRDVKVLFFLQDSGDKTVLMSSWAAGVSNDRCSGQNG